MWKEMKTGKNRPLEEDELEFLDAVADKARGRSRHWAQPRAPDVPRARGALTLPSLPPSGFVRLTQERTYEQRKKDEESNELQAFQVRPLCPLQREHVPIAVRGFGTHSSQPLLHGGGRRFAQASLAHSSVYLFSFDLSSRCTAYARKPSRERSSGAFFLLHATKHPSCSAPNCCRRPGILPGFLWIYNPVHFAADKKKFRRQ